MPTSRSAKKRMRQNQVRRSRNRARKSTMRTQVKKVLQAVEQSDLTRAETELRMAVKKLDQAAAKRVVHPNLAARAKSRLTRRVNELRVGATAG